MSGRYARPVAKVLILNIGCPIGYTGRKERIMNKLYMALCEGRHSIPDAVDGAIFPATIEDVTDVRGLEVAAEAAIARAALAHYRAGESQYLPTAKYAQAVEGMGRFPRVDAAPGFGLVLYVTGLTVATVAVINVCIRVGISLTLMHYNRDTGSYYPQDVRLPG